MTSRRKKVTKADAPVNNTTKTVAARAQRADTEGPMLALMPSAAELRQMVARPAQDASFRSSDADLGAALDIPPALLNPLASLPRPISLDEVKEPPRATVAARKRQTK
jgi:hypothetical protein